MTEFIPRHIGITETEQTQMLEDLGLSSLDELVRQIVPDSILLRGDYKLPSDRTRVLWNNYSTSNSEKCF